MAFPTIDATIYGVGTFDTDTAPGGTLGGTLVNSNAAFICVAVIRIGGDRQGLHMMFINGTGTGAALTHLKLTRSSVDGGHALGTPQIKDWKVDAGLNPAAGVDNEITSSSSGLSTLGANLMGDLKLDRLQGIQEIGVWAECASSTNLRVVGSVF